MLLKKFYLVLFAALLGFSIIGCGSDSDTKSTEPSVTDEQAVEMSDSVMKAVNSAFGEAQIQKGEATKTIVSNEWDYEGNGWSAHVEYSYDDPDTYPWTFDIVFTWESFTYVDNTVNITISNGTAEVVYDVPSDTMFSYDYTGDFDVLYQGTTYDFSWAISVDYNYPNYTYAGTYTINGYNYTYSGSGTVKE